MRFFKAILILPLALLAVLLGIITLVLVYAQTDSGQRRIVGLVESLTAGTNSRVTIGTLEGAIPTDFTVTGLEVADAQGVWLSIDRLHLDWSPLALLSRDLRIDVVEAGTILVERRPLPGEPQPEEPSGGLPTLPGTVSLDRLTVGELILRQRVLGEEARVTIDASARIGAPEEGISAMLEVARTDGVDGQISLDLLFVPETEALTLSLSASEPEGGLIARLASLPDLPPVTVALEGDGTLDDWRATLTAEAPGAFDIAADARIRAEGEDRLLTLDLVGDVAALAPETARPLIGEQVTLDADLLVSPDRVVRISRALLTAAAADLTVDGTFDPAEGVLDLTYELDAGAVEIFAGILPDASWGSVGIDGTIEGPTGQPVITATLAAEDVALPQASFDALETALTIDPQGPIADPATEIAVSVEGGVTGLSLGAATVDEFVRSRIGWTVDMALTRAGDVTLDALAIDLPSGSLQASGSLEGWGLVASDLDARLQAPDLAAFRSVVGRPVDGSVDLAAAIRSKGLAGEATIDGVLENVVTGIPQIDGLLGARTTLTGQVTRSAEGIIDLTDIALDAEGIDAKVGGRIAPREVRVGWVIDLPDLSRLGPDLSGSVRSEGTIAGPMRALRALTRVDATNIVTAGRSIPEATLIVEAGDLTGDPWGRIVLLGTAEGLPIRASARFALEEEGVAEVRDIAIDIASLGLGGDLTVTQSPFAITGTIEGGVERLADFSALAGQALAGSATIGLSFAAPEGVQTLDAALGLQGARLGEAARIAAADVEATLADLFGAPSIDADLTASGIEAGGQTIDSVTASAEGSFTDMAVALDVSAADAALSTEGGVALTEGATRIDLASLTAAYKGEELTLVQPATIALAGRDVTVDGLALSVGGGTVSLDGRYGSDMDLALTIEALPLSLARLAAPAAEVDGTLNAEARLQGSLPSPTGNFTIDVADLRVPQAADAGFTGFDIRTTGSLGGGRLDVRSGVALAEDSRFDLTASLPVTFDPATAVPSIPPEGRISGAADGMFDLALLNPLLAAGADQVAGRLEVALTVDGTMAGLDSAGRVTLSEGLYRNVLNGTEITDIAATLEAQGREMTLTRLTGRTPNGGSIEGSGSILLDPKAGLPLDISLTLTDAELVDSDLVNAVTDADLHLSGELLTEALLEGTITIDRAEIRIPDTMPPSVAVIEVTEVNAPPEIQERLDRQAERQARASEGSAVSITLDLVVSAPNQIYVRGRGLDAEMGGDLTIEGTSAAPRVTGAFTLRRGVFDLLGNRFDFERGSVTLTGANRIDPMLDFLAVAPLEDITAQIAITGRASDPQIDVSSIPELPDDEVLSRILFGKATGELNALEAVRLAQSVATLTGVGAGGDVLGDLRDSLGVDRLSVEAGSGDAGPSLSVGEYIADDVLVGIEQGLDGSGSRVTVEIEVTPNISVNSGVGADSSSIGVEFQWDY
ncbi:translocation/assembly module TamB domain-containing protein [Inquilinus sp. CAU 1745]|uniref:translocation/assembly module TamB domain-containing protein n=1 Tax=Inquilinus sp. CAU 1745 TaxID=3140369 RepID=UPI00325AFBA1